MPNPAPADFKITVFVTGPNAQSMLWGLYCNTLPAFTLTNFETWVDGTAGGEFLDILSVSYTLQKVRYESSSGFTEVFFNDAGTNAVAADAAPSTAVLVSVQTNSFAVPGVKRATSRFYWPGCLADANVNSLGQIDGAYRTVLQATADGLFAALAADNLVPVVRHEGDNSTTDATQFFVQGYIGTQRRRLHRTNV